MRVYVLAFIATLMATSAAWADKASDTAAAVRAADKAFAQAAQREGMAKAFRDFMDPADGLSYGGVRPVRGADAIFRALGGGKPEKARLEWVVTNAWGSQGGDMGVTVGEWRRTLIGAAKPANTGRYVTVWRRDPKGVWKGLIDIGEVDETPRKNAANP